MNARMVGCLRFLETVQTKSEWNFVSALIAAWLSSGRISDVTILLSITIIDGELQNLNYFFLLLQQREIFISGLLSDIN
jgi:hypothetical protein